MAAADTLRQFGEYFAATALALAHETDGEPLELDPDDLPGAAALIGYANVAFQTAQLAVPSTNPSEIDAALEDLRAELEEAGLADAAATQAPAELLRTVLAYVKAARDQNGATRALSAAVGVLYARLDRVGRNFVASAENGSSPAARQAALVEAALSDARGLLAPFQLVPDTDAAAQAAPDSEEH